MIRFRKALALAALVILAALIVSSNPRVAPGGSDRLTMAVWPLLIPLVLTVVGLIREAYWSRWLALAAGLAVLPWAGALLLTSGYGIPVVRPALALSASLMLLVSLPGDRMIELYEGRVRGSDWSTKRMTLVRWTIIWNIASALALYLFVVAYDYRIEWHVAIAAVLLLGLLTGVVLLAHQRTIGVLLVALCCVCFVPAGGYFVWKEASHAGEAILFAMVFLPGVLTGWATLFAFSGAMWRYLRAG